MKLILYVGNHTALLVEFTLSIETLCTTASIKTCKWEIGYGLAMSKKAVVDNELNQYVYEDEESKSWLCVYHGCTFSTRNRSKSNILWHIKQVHFKKKGNEEATNSVKTDSVTSRPSTNSDIEGQYDDHDISAESGPCIDIDISANQDRPKGCCNAVDSWDTHADLIDCSTVVIPHTAAENEHELVLMNYLENDSESDSDLSHSDLEKFLLEACKPQQREAEKTIWQTERERKYSFKLYCHSTDATKLSTASPSSSEQSGQDLAKKAVPPHTGITCSASSATW